MLLSRIFCRFSIKFLHDPLQKRLRCGIMKKKRNEEITMVKRDLSYGTLPEQKLDFYDCSKPDAPLFVFFHGGGLEAGNKGNGDERAFLELNEAGISVATADYRMYPSAKFPDFIEDAALCVAWCRDHLPHSVLTVGGSSAGGYLSMMLAFDGRYLGKYGIDSSDKSHIAGYFFDAGQPTTHFNVLREGGLDTRLVRVDEAAPIYFIGQPESPETLPGYEFVVADNDMAGRLEQTELLCRTMFHVGYPDDCVTFTYMEGYTHTGYCGVVKDGRSLYADMIKAFMKRTLE